MATPSSFMPRRLIGSRLQAERAAAGSTMAAALMAFMFALGAFSTWGTYPAPAFVYALCALLAGVSAIVMDRRKSVLIAGVILAGAALLTAWGVMSGHGKMITWLALILPAAVTGLQGARALRRTDLPLWT